MRLSQIGELTLLAEIRKRFSKREKSIIVGIGDDGAVIEPSRFLRGQCPLVATTDMMVEGVHFSLSFATPFQIGFKLISVNVSDIYAMGATPHYALLNVSLKSDTDISNLYSFLDGIDNALKLYKVSLVGGDLSSSPNGMTVSATLIGSVRKPLMRKGARVGNKIYVTGTLGDSAGGLYLLKKIKRPIVLHRPLNTPLRWDIMRPLLERHLMPFVRDPKSFLKSHATSMIDISDGLLIDLIRLCDESKVGARIYEDKIPISNELKSACIYLGLNPLQLALKGGEDYELLFSAPFSRKINAVCIGEITRKERIIIDSKGKELPIKPEGYKHFNETKG
ncbi:MAG: thiamine-phosphate kinase [Nitrospirae bacterium]|nr:thiamine-phosphate kinase [Nitrospirota bacterium]